MTVNIDKLPKISEIVNSFSKEIKEKNIVTLFGEVQSISDLVKEKWQKVAKQNNEEMIFFDADVLVKSKDGYIYSTIAELLIASYGFKIYRMLKDYQEFISELKNKNSVISNPEAYSRSVKEAKKDGTGPLVDTINNSSLSQINKDKLLEFCTNYASWHGGKTIDRNDFWQSPFYGILGFVQSRSGIHSYIDYLRRDSDTNNSELLNAMQNEIYSLLHQKPNITSSISSPSTLTPSDSLTTAPVSISGANIIYYGAPGTGKSHKLDELIKKENTNTFRVTLHPEYTYSDFVGQLLPVSKKANDGNDKYTVSYEFVPGIFTIALKEAINNPDRSVYLILEELSRANVAAVFGDLFQLLDRKNGISEYPIDNPDISKIIYGKANTDQDTYKKIYIPNNLSILATVNTSDQNVYPMDTAFKRRFEWRYVSTDYGSNSEDFKNNNNPTIDVGDNIRVTWDNLYKGLNSFIVGELGLNEDKQIGPYFIKFEGANGDKAHDLVKDKLLQYLWEDINKVANTMSGTGSSLFLGKQTIPSFSELYTRFSDRKQVFSDIFLDKLGVQNDSKSLTD
ncbi:AAA family ATPase [Lactobacillus johnsonii]|uniref:AAA family ATPase n=1 Tax=Lactobacillus johnsonii TaxID=33959 RepID=UPI00398246EF